MIFLSKQAETAPSAAIIMPSGTASFSEIPAPTIVTTLSEIIFDKFPLGRGYHFQDVQLLENL